MRISRWLGLLPSILSLAACFDQATVPAPDVPKIAVGDEVVGQVQPGDRVEYWIQGTRAEKFRIELSLLDAHEADTLRLEVVGLQTSYVVTSLRASGAEPPSRVMELFPGSVPYLVRVHGAADRQIRFRFRVETGERVVAVGDTVAGELMALPRDLPDRDSYRFTGRKGQEIVLFFQSAQSQQPVLATLTGPGGAPLAELVSAAAQPVLEALGTARIVLPTDGDYVVRVEGQPVGALSYRFHLYEVDRAPEAITPDVALGTPVSGEAIDAVGDVDEFRFTGAKDQLVVASLWVEQGLEGGVALSLADHSVSVQGTADTVATERIPLSASGQHTVRISGRTSGAPSTDTGRYGFTIHGVDRAPERLNPNLPGGERVTGEAIDHPGDIDEFIISAPAGTEMNVVLETEPGSSGPLRTQVFSPSGALVASGKHTTPRFVISGAGDHTVVVQDHPSGSGFVGPYTIHAHLVRRGPESVSAAIDVGSWVRGEAIDEMGDIDVFTYHAPEGQELNIFARCLPGATGLIIVRREEIGYRRFNLQRDCDDPFGQWLGVFRAPHTGDHGVLVDGMDGRGGYELLVYPIRGAPEHVPPVFAVGDTVRGEDIFPAGDVDEFTFTASEGEAMNVHFTALHDGLVIQIERADTGESLMGLRSNHPRDWGGFTIPATGEYRVRVQGYLREEGSGWYPELQVGEYAFSIVRRPEN